VDSRDPTLRGRSGVIVDETRRTILLQEGERVIRIPKNVVVLKFTLPNGEEVEVDGRKTIMRPEERIKNL